MNKINYIKKYINTKVDIDQSVPFGFVSSVSSISPPVGDKYLYGKRNIEENLPFESDSIYRMASQSKFMGTVAFLKLIDRGIVTWDTPLKDYLPEFSAETLGVIEPYQLKSTTERVWFNPLITQENSNLIIVNVENSFTEGDYISLEWSNGPLDTSKNELPTVNGLNGFEVFNIFKIHNVTSHKFHIRVSSTANISGSCGGFIKVRLLEKGVKRSIFLGPSKVYINPVVETYYYQLKPLKRELTILDVLTHGLGWSYYTYAMLYMSFGYSKDIVKNNIQAGIWNELGLPVGIPLSCYKCGIREWSRLASNIPLLYQPGEDWSYGPQLSLLGALIEEIDGRSTQQYLTEELWEPLGMKDTGFFLSNEDQKQRLCELYVNMPKIILKFMGENFIHQFQPIQEAHKCLYEGPKSLCLIDSGMYTTVDDYSKFLGSFFDGSILSDQMLNILSKYETPFDVTNLGSVSSYSFASGTTERCDGILKKIKWGLGVGKVTDKSILTWAGVLGTRFLIDFEEKIAYNVGTNVIGPPAGSFDVELIELSHKPMIDIDYKLILADLLF